MSLYIDGQFISNVTVEKTIQLAYRYYKGVGINFYQGGETYIESTIESAEWLLTQKEWEAVKAQHLEKHPFRNYYENNIKPGDVNKNHNFKSDLVIFLESFLRYSKISEDLWFFFPNVDKEHVDFVYLWLDFKGREKGREGRVKMKPGKAFRRIFPYMTDVEIEQLVDKFKEQFSPVNLTVHETKDPDKIAEVYTMERSQDRNFYTTSYHKRLCDSCMRYDFDHLEHHPTYAFGSGDFTVFYALDGRGKLSGRVTVYTECDEPQSGPIYATCGKAIEVLTGKLEEIGATEAGRGDWEGAKILALRDGDNLYGPYLDQAESLDDQGNFLVISSTGNIKHHHEGHYTSGSFCDWCEEYVDSTTYIGSVGRDVCECCRENDFFFCDYDGEEYPDHYMVSVYCEHGYESWAEENAQKHATLCYHDGEYWANDYVEELANGDYVSKKYIGDYFNYCTIDGELYENDEMTEVEGKWYNTKNLEEQQEEEEEAA